MAKKTRGGRRKLPASERVQQAAIYPKAKEIDLLKQAARTDGHVGSWNDWVLTAALEKARRVLVG